MTSYFAGLGLEHLLEEDKGGQVLSDKDPLPSKDDKKISFAFLRVFQDFGQNLSLHSVQADKGADDEIKQWSFFNFIVYWDFFKLRILNHRIGF